MEKKELDEIKAWALDPKVTPGPWYWQLPASGISVRLYTPKNGYCIVMDFVRRGTQGAQPRFSDRGNAPLGGIMHKAEEIDLNKNPDSVFIARSRAAVPALVEEVEKLRAALETERNAADNLLSGLGIWGYKSAGQTLPTEIVNAIGKFEIERIKGQTE